MVIIIHINTLIFIFFLTKQQTTNRSISFHIHICIPILIHSHSPHKTTSTQMHIIVYFIVFVLLIVYWWFKYPMSQLSHIPGPKPSLFFGNYSELTGKYYKTQQKWAEQYGPVLKVEWLFLLFLDHKTEKNASILFVLKTTQPF